MELLAIAESLFRQYTSPIWPDVRGIYQEKCAIYTPAQVLTRDPTAGNRQISYTLYIQSIFTIVEKCKHMYTITYTCTRISDRRICWKSEDPSDRLFLILVFAEWVNDCSEWFLDLFSGGDVATFVFAKLEMKMHFQPSLPASLFPLELILFQPSFKLSTYISSKRYSLLVFFKCLQVPPHPTPLGLISFHPSFKSSIDISSKLCLS